MATSPSSLPASPFSPSPSSSPPSQPSSSMLNPLAPPFTFPPPPPPPQPAYYYVYTLPRVPACCIQATVSPSCYVPSPYYTPTYILYSCPPSFLHIMSPPSLKPLDQGIMATTSPEVPAAPEVLKKTTTPMSFPLRRRYQSSTPSKPEAMNLQRTTVMIRNIPNKLSREMLIELLDKHCTEQNERSCLSAYDFVYLPMDFKKRRNLGYAFVNFTKPEAARRLFDCMQGYRWNIFGSSKVTHVCNARIQGKMAMLGRFKDSFFECDTDDFLPVIFSPARDGADSRPAPAVIGRRLPDRLLL